MPEPAPGPRGEPGVGVKHQPSRTGEKRWKPGKEWGVVGGKAGVLRSLCYDSPMAGRAKDDYKPASGGRELADLPAVRDPTDGRVSALTPVVLLYQDKNGNERAKVLCSRAGEGTTPLGRDKLVLDMLWCLSLRGDVKAGATYLGFRKWQVEMKKGKATQRSEHEETRRIYVVDNLTTPTRSLVEHPVTGEVKALPTGQPAVVDVEAVDEGGEATD